MPSAWHPFFSLAASCIRHKSTRGAHCLALGFTYVDLHSGAICILSIPYFPHFLCTSNSQGSMQYRCTHCEKITWKFYWIVLVGKWDYLGDISTSRVTTTVHELIASYCSFSLLQHMSSWQWEEAFRKLRIAQKTNTARSITFIYFQGITCNFPNAFVALWIQLILFLSFLIYVNALLQSTLVPPFFVCAMMHEKKTN